MVRYFSRYLLGIGFCLIIGLSRPCILGADAGLSYVVSLEGVTDRKLKKILEAVSETVGLRERPPASLHLLRNRVKQDIPRFLKVLRSQGFYSPEVTAEIDEDIRPIQSQGFYGPEITAEIDEGIRLIQVTFRIQPGPPYLLKSVNIQVSGEATTLGVKPPEVNETGLILGEPAKSKRILEAEQVILLSLKRQGFPFPKIEKREVVVDHATRSVAVNFQVQSGPRARFGSTQIEGLESVDELYMRSKIPWNEGGLFDVDLFKEFRKRLRATGLFATIRVTSGVSLDHEGRLPVLVNVRERKHRTIKVGISYKSDQQGFGGKMIWEHRNLFGRAERLTLEGNASEITYAGEGKFRKPDFLRSDQALVLSLRLADDFPDAFTSRNLEGLAKIERILSKGLGLGVGLGFRFSDVEQFGQEERYSLLYLPAELDWDRSDRPLDPSKGGRLTFQLTPYHDFSGTDLSFLKGYGHYSQYIQILKKPSLVFAVRGTLGAMGGAEREEIPADLRFYSGGSGSVRGYNYQFVGPLFNGQPIGGRSLIGLSSELRTKVTETIGFVAFLDGGNVYESAFPDFEQSLFWGAGAGIRYFTPVGPLRLDVGIPLNRREGIDDSFQIYVSLGQAF